MNRRWYLVDAQTRELAPGPNHPEGFDTRADARAFHRNVRRGDPRLVVVAVTLH